MHQGQGGERKQGYCQESGCESSVPRNRVRVCAIRSFYIICIPLKRIDCQHETEYQAYCRNNEKFPFLSLSVSRVRRPMGRYRLGNRVPREQQDDRRQQCEKDCQLAHGLTEIPFISLHQPCHLLMSDYLRMTVTNLWVLPHLTSLSFVTV